MRLALLATMMALTLSGCALVRSTLATAQAELSPYLFRFEGEAHGVLFASSMGFAVEAGVDVTVAFEKDGEVLWTRHFQHSTEARAYALLFVEGDDGGIAELVRIPWSEAQRIFPGLPDARTPPMEFVPDRERVPLEKGGAE